MAIVATVSTSARKSRRTPKPHTDAFMFQCDDICTDINGIFEDHGLTAEARSPSFDGSTGRIGELGLLPDDLQIDFGADVFIDAADKVEAVAKTLLKIATEIRGKSTGKIIQDLPDCTLFQAHDVNEKSLFTADAQAMRRAMADPNAMRRAMADPNAHVCYATPVLEAL